MAVKRAMEAALAINTGIAENDGLGNDVFVADLYKTVDSNSSPQATLSKCFA